MIKKIVFIFGITLFPVFLKCAEGMHVVYSHAWYEDTTCKKYDHTNQKWLDCPSVPGNEITFKENKAIKSSSGKDVLIGDDDTTFYNSHAMKFAHLGDSLSMPSYEGEPRSWSLYTQKNVCALADHLYYQVNTRMRKKIVLVGPCVGASIAINCLKKLVNFNENQDYFKDTFIKKEGDAQKIIAAINNGGFVGIVPLMSIKKHNAVALPAAVLSGLTLAAMAAAACHKVDVVDDTKALAVGLMGAGLLASCTVGGYFKNMYATIIKYSVVPVLSGFNYNPFHEDPIDNIESLKKKITWPVALNFTEQDYVMEWCDDDLKKICEVFGGTINLRITSDAGHMQISPEFQQYLKNSFKEQLKSTNSWFVLLEEDKNNSDLKKKDFLYHMFGSKKWLIGLTFLCVFCLWMKMAHFLPA